MPIDPTLPVHCDDTERRADVAASTEFNGIDWIEVDPADQRVLLVGFLHPLPGEPGAQPGPPAPAIEPANVSILGGVRVVGIDVVAVAAAGSVLTVTVDGPGDFSTYVLRLVRSGVDDRAPEGFDPALAGKAFSFKAGCPSIGDCRPPRSLGERPEGASVVIDYLARTEPEVRRLMLDRLSTLLPDRRETNPADGLVTVVEALAHVADRVAYRQDAIGTEAYLDTARRRISVRRHARLLDYAVNDGCNARTWIQMQVLPGSGAEITGFEPGLEVLSGPTTRTIADPEEAARLAAAGATTFSTLEPLHPLETRNEITLHTWGGTRCCLPQGATRASLRGGPELGLAPGDLLLLEEIRSPVNGRRADADPARRQVVRLVAVELGEDPVPTTPAQIGPRAVTEVRWHAADALTFALQITAVVDEQGGPVTCAVARGNLVLAHEGATRPARLGPVAPTRWRPLLADRPVANVEPLDGSPPAAGLLVQDPRRCLPKVELSSDRVPWSPRRDLLGGDRFDRGFVVEVERDGTAWLRFGDDVHGQSAPPGAEFEGRWLAGGGTAGNVGRDVLTRPVTVLDGVVATTNPLPARGGTDPESMEHARQHAPSAFQTQERAVTTADWVEVAERQDEVQRAAARLRWTGSWWTVFLTLDLFGGRRLVDEPELEAALLARLDRFRVAGYDLELRDPVDVPVVLGLHVCVDPLHPAAEVRDGLRAALSGRSGRSRASARGLFHPDRLSFGDPVYVSAVLAVAASVPGVATVEVTELHPVGAQAAGELEAGVLTVGDTEVARLDDDPSVPERGQLVLELEGGR